MRNAVIRHGAYIEIVIGTRQGNISAFVDTEDFDTIDVEGQYVMFKDKKGRPLARGCKESGQQFIHKKIVGDIPRSSTLVYKNGNSLDYRKSNLQIIDKDGNITELAPPEPPKVEKPKAPKVAKAAKPAAPKQKAKPQTPKDPDRVRGKPEKEKRSDVPGVYHHKASNRWHAAGFYEGKRWSLGYFGEQADAEREIGIFRQHGPHYEGLKRNQKPGGKQK